MTLPGSIPVYAFSLLIGAAASIGLGRMLRSPDAPFSLAWTGWLALAAALAGARLGAFVIQPEAPLFQFPLGGLSWAGALAGGLAGGLLAARLSGRPALETADRLIPLAAALTAAAWLGCWLEGCAYGPVSDAVYALPAPDEWGNLASRLPLQAAGALLAAGTYFAAEILSGRSRPGVASAAWLMLTGIQFWWLHGLRADPAPTWAGLRPDLWAAGAVTALGLIFLAAAVYASRRSLPHPPEPPNHEM